MKFHSLFPCVFLPLFSVCWLGARSPVTLFAVFPHASAVPPDHSHRHSQPCAQNTDRFLQFPAVIPEECKRGESLGKCSSGVKDPPSNRQFLLSVTLPSQPPILIINISRVNEIQSQSAKNKIKKGILSETQSLAEVFELKPFFSPIICNKR